MKNLLLTTVVALTFFIPGISFAGENVFGVKLPVERQEVKSNVKAGSHIAKDNSLVNTLISQKPRHSQLATYESSNDEETYYVFGVNIKAKNLI